MTENRSATYKTFEAVEELLRKKDIVGTQDVQKGDGKKTLVSSAHTMEIDQRKNELHLYPINDNEYIGAIDVDVPNMCNTSQTIVILDVSGSMGPSVARFVKEILPLFMSKMNYSESYPIHLISFASKTIYNAMLRKELMVSDLKSGGGTTIGPAIEKLCTILERMQRDDAGTPIRVLTISDGGIGDRENAEKETKKLTDFLATSELTINSQAVRLFTSDNQPDTKALSYLLQINNTTTTNLCDIKATESIENIANAIVALFRSDGFHENQILQFQKSIVLRFPWNCCPSMRLILALGWNIFWLKLVPTGAVKLGTDIIKVIIEGQLSLAAFHKLMETKLAYIADHMTILKIVGTTEANVSVEKIFEYFKKTEEVLALKCSTTNNKIITNLLDGIAKNKTNFSDSAQMAEFLRKTNKEIESQRRKEKEAREKQIEEENRLKMEAEQEEARRKQIEDENRRKVEAEQEEARRKMEAEQEEMQRKQIEDENRRKMEAEQEEARRKQIEDENRRKVEAEQEEARRKIEAEQEEMQRKQIEEENRLKMEAEQEEARRKQIEDEYRRKVEAEQEEGRRKMEAEQEEMQRKQIEEESRRKMEAEQEEARRKQIEDENRRKVEAEQEEACRKMEAEQEEMQRKQIEEENRLKMEAEQEEARRKQIEDEYRRKVEAEQEEGRRKMDAEQEEIQRKQIEDENRRKMEAEQEDARNKRIEAENRRKVEAEQEDSRRKMDGEQEEKRRKQIEDENRRKMDAEQEEVRRRQIEEEHRVKMEAEQEELRRKQIEDDEERVKREVVERIQQEVEERLKREFEERVKQEVTERHKLSEVKRLGKEPVCRKKEELLERNAMEITTGTSKCRTDMDQNSVQTVFILDETRGTDNDRRFTEKIIPLMLSKHFHENPQLLQLVTFVRHQTTVKQMLRSLEPALDGNKRIRIFVLADGEVHERLDIDNLSEALIKFLNESNYSFELEVVRLTFTNTATKRYKLIDIDVRESNEFIAKQIAQFACDKQSTDLHIQNYVESTGGIRNYCSVHFIVFVIILAILFARYICNFIF